MKYLWDRLKGNFRAVGREFDTWKHQHHKVHYSRIQAATNWWRSQGDNDGKLHAIKNYWTEFVRACPRIVAEVILLIVVMALLISILKQVSF